ncbi:MAG: DUF4347 domain-containing protein [Lachnospiraceae bacterium]|nr:DUF4347 domain-containing protein [Lachnospiraceae bacterium]
MWEEFDNTCSFSRAAQTKKKELIEKGVAEENIKYFRIDGGQELLDLWNDTWTGYKRVQELHLFSHGKPGTPEVYCGTTGYICEEIYKKLNFSSNAGCYFYGCNIANISKYMNKFATNQNVITYAFDEGTSFSGDYSKKTSILFPGGDVYLAPYVIPGEKSWREVDTNEWYAVLVVAPRQLVLNGTLHIRGRKPFRRFYPEQGDD